MRNYKVLLVLAGFLLGSLNVYGSDLSTMLGSGSGDSNGDTKSIVRFNVNASFQSKPLMIRSDSLRIIIKPLVNIPGIKSYSKVLNNGDFWGMTNLPMNIGAYDVTFYVLKSNGRVLAHKKVRIKLSMDRYVIKWKVIHLSGDLIPNGYQPIIDVSDPKQWKLRVQPR